MQVMKSPREKSNAAALGLGDFLPGWILTLTELGQ